MFCLFKGIAKTAFWGVAILGGLAVGTTLIAGPHQTKEVVQHIRSTVQQTIDEVHGDLKDNPVALRAQLQRLEAEYPKRIRAVQKDLGELQMEARRLSWEQAVSERVVAMAQADLQNLAQSHALGSNAPSEAAGPHRQAGFARGPRFAGTSSHGASGTVAVTQARLESLTLQHQQNAQDAARDLGYINKEIQRFENLLTELETERAQYHSQLQQLNRQVDSIRRNERLLAMLRERQGLFENASRFESHSLDHITGRLAGIRSQQEAELELLAGHEIEVDYEGRAKAELQWENQTLESQAVPLQSPSLRIESPASCSTDMR